MLLILYYHFNEIVSILIWIFNYIVYMFSNIYLIIGMHMSQQKPWFFTTAFVDSY